MSRQPRLQSQNGIYHVMLRGVNRQQIFENEDDYRKFIFILHDMISPKDELRRPLPPRCIIYSYCLMPNHVHLLIQEKEEKISVIVKQIASRYAIYYNGKYEHFGHLFQDRFKSEPVSSYSYFLTLIRYIHQNPVAGKLCDTVEDYDWSSWREYERVPRICNTKPLISRMPFEDLKALVFEPLPKTVCVLDIDNERRRRTDDEVSQFLISEFGLRHVQDILLLSKERQKDAIRLAREYGASIRQIERLTGIGFSIICRN